MERDSLVVVKNVGGKQTPITDTLIFAKRFEIRHDKLLAKCREILEMDSKINLPHTGEIKNHIILSKYRDSKKRNYPKYILTERGFLTLLTEVSTPKNDKAKVKLYQTRQEFIRAFELMQEMLLRQQNEEWKTVREQGKLIRREETDAIKEFVEYAKSQGSKNADWYYKHFTNATYKALKLLQYKEKGVRELLDTFQLHQLAIAEHKVAYWISEEIRKGTYYKDIFKNVKEKLFELAPHISFTPRVTNKHN